MGRITEFQWLVYSRKAQGGFCVVCALFAKEDDRKHVGQLVNKLFIKLEKEEYNSTPT